MTVQGHIENGAVVFDEPGTLPEGAKVKVILITTAPDDEEGEQLPTLYERLKPIIGIVKDMPPDSSRNLDHYLYGAPKE